jgi:hypothetical protein
VTSGFLVRYDGSLISIDEIIWIELMPIEGHYRGYHIVIHMNSGWSPVWNGEPLTDTQAASMMLKLKDLIKKAIEL